MSLSNVLTHGKLQRCQTLQSDMTITAEIMQTAMTSQFAIAQSNGSVLLKIPSITQHEVPFINTSEATKRSRDRTENGKCTDVKNRRSRVG